MFNLKLKHRELKKKTIKDPLCLDDVDSGNEWISELQNPEVEVYENLDANIALDDSFEVKEGELFQHTKKRKKKNKRYRKNPNDDDEEDFPHAMKESEEEEAKLNFMDNSLEDPNSSTSSSDNSDD
nr:uncharacterized protein LOC124813191 [Hydra vulgaris]